MGNYISKQKNSLIPYTPMETSSLILKERKIIWDREKTIFKDALEQYDDFISKIAVLIHELGYSSVLECSLMVGYLIDNGYLSYDFDFIDGNPKKEIIHRLGTSILTGTGCCRNYSNMLKDVLSCMNEYVDTMFCYQGKIKFTNNKANHMINLVKHEDYIYGLDLYNNKKLFRFENPIELKEITYARHSSLLYKPDYEVLVGETDWDTVKEKLKLFQDMSEKKTIGHFEYEKYYKRAVRNKMDNEHDRLFDFHEKTKLLKKEIADSIIKK